MLKRRPSHATVVAYLALFAALSGVAYAATLPRNSVGAKQIKKSAVRSSDVKDGALLAKDFKAGQLPAGEPGPKGDKGDPGQPGAPGAWPSCPAGTVLHEFACVETATRNATTFGSATNACLLAEGRLPTIGELMTLGHRSGVTLESREWAEGMFTDEMDIWANTYAENGGRGLHDTGAAYRFRCVRPASF